MNRKPLRLRFQLLAIALIRMVLSTGNRAIYPFLPTFARGLGVPLGSLNLIVTSRAAVAFLGPFLAGYADGRDRRSAMLAGLALFSGAMALVTLWPTYPALFIGVLLALAGKVICDPATHAFVADRVPYARRGLAIAFSEVSWSGAYLLGIPLLGWLIARSDWRAPFAALAAFGLGAALLVYLALPAAPAPAAKYGSGHRAPPAARAASTPLSLLLSLRGHPAARATLLTGVLISAANENVNIVYGAWMEGAFGLQVTALAAATAVVGLSELAGEGLVAALADRLGKRVTLLGGLLLSAAACLALPLLAFNLTFALVGLFFFYLTFEFSIVVSLPLLTEQVPAARATVMGANIAGHALGRVIGSLAGPLLFRHGFLWNGLAGVMFNLLGAALLLALVRPGSSHLD